MEKIFIGNNFLSKINQLFDFSRFSKLAILTDTNVAKHWLLPLKKSLKKKTSEIIIQPGEKEKNIKTVKNIWKKMFDFGLDRKSLLINLGGGVICDIGGFSASTFMRGIEFLNIPTTLLAQVDASVGGKTGIDFEGIKNGIGVFKNPMRVIIDVAVAKVKEQRPHFSPSITVKVPDEPYVDTHGFSMIEDELYIALDNISKHSGRKISHEVTIEEIGRASCRERV